MEIMDSEPPHLANPCGFSCFTELHASFVVTANSEMPRSMPSLCSASTHSGTS
ncbi:Hypothetical protein Tcol_2354 [Trichococcus collinsii]|uniref:Uncharacterized protein n=1 Tax=Trichococcus collinsii TaxID=157076 RepID=A0AB38A206_9LACT|nr:Hypothetical protein Tcol_2354 [Trichococcus collinsii]SEA73593.1 hypothetical protein SAMN04488525_10511 [Trichococcus collinsii]